MIPPNKKRVPTKMLKLFSYIVGVAGFIWKHQIHNNLYINKICISENLP
jgi:hypothetical protein